MKLAEAILVPKEGDAKQNFWKINTGSDCLINSSWGQMITYIFAHS